MKTKSKSTEAPSGLALLVLDIQDTFLRVLPAAGAPLVSRCAFVAAAARLLNIPTALTEQVPEKLGPLRPEIRAAAGPDARVFPKTSFSALGAPALAKWLRDKSASHLLLAGLEIPICIYLTALDAIAADLDVTILTDATGGRRMDDFPHIWRMLETAGARLLPSETVFYSILQGANHPRFRDYTALVKQNA